MKIVFTGGGTGGHFYPIIAVAEEINAISREKKLLEPNLYYIAPMPYDRRVLYENNISFRKSPAGKMRRYFSILNIFDFFKTGVGLIKAFWQMFFIYPDVVFSKGGYASFPATFAAKILRIPVVLHESDAIPGRVSLWTGKFARKIAVSYPEAVKYFDKDIVAYTGNPIRKDLFILARAGAREYLKLESNIPTVVIFGGSQGAQIINNTIIDALPQLVEKYQIIHQTGKKNIKEISSMANIVLKGSPYKNRYKPFGYLNTLAVRMAAGAADIAVSRAGSTIFEIAIWGLPSIIVPITNSNGDHQRRNAFAYARSGACVVIEEKNLSSHVLASEIKRLIEKPELRERMSAEAKKFSKPDAARKIAEVIIGIALKHEE